MSNAPVVVYGLFASDEGDVRYIGQTRRDPIVRLRQHMIEARRGNARRQNWIRSVLARGASVEMCVLRTNAEWSTTEMEVLAEYRRLGADLVNGTDGGEGCLNPSPEVRAKMGDSKRGVKRTAEVKAKLRASNLRRFLCPHERERTAALTRESMKKPDVQEKLMRAVQARWSHPDARRRAAEASARSASRPETRVRMSRGAAKLTDEQVLEARRQRLRGAKITDLCVQYGLTPCPMSLLCRGLTFKHVPMP